MIEQVHRHITSELQQNTKTDIIFILSAIILNLIILAVNAGFVDKSRGDTTYLFIMFLFVTLLLLLNLVIIYNTRYNLFMMVVVLTGLISIVVPFVMR